MAVSKTFQVESSSDKKEKTKSSDGLSLLLFHVCRWNFSITTVGIFSLIPKATRRRKLVEERRLSKNSMGTFFFKSENLGKRRNACVQLFGGNSHGHLRLSFRMLEKVQTATHTAQRGNKTTKPIVPPAFYL